MIQGVCFAQDEPAADMPDGKALVLKAVQAMGGSETPDEKVMLQHTTIVPAEMKEAGNAPEKMIAVTAAPFRLHLEAHWPTGKSAFMAFDGEYLWGNDEDDPAVHLKPDSETQQFMAFTPVLTPQGYGMRLLQLFNTFETVDLADVESAECYVVSATHSENEMAIDILIDKASGMLKGFSTGEGEGGADLIIREWADHNGNKVVRKAQASGMAPTPITFEYTEYSNPEMKRRLWRQPDEVKEEIKREETAGGGGG